MTNRWLWLVLCAASGLVMLACGLAVPAHLKALDVTVLGAAGRTTTTLPVQALRLANERELGPARLLLEAGERENIPGLETVARGLKELAAQNPTLRADGAATLPLRLASGTRTNQAGGLPTYPITDILVQTANRESTLGFLKQANSPALRQLLDTRALTNTVILPPAESSAGQVYDTAIALCGLLLHQGRLSPQLSNAIVAAATAANRGAPTAPFEQPLLDLLSLGQRFDWGQLAAFVSQARDPETLRLLSNLARKEERGLPLLFAAVELSGNPARVARYLMTFSQTGLRDLGRSLHYGSGGVKLVLERQQRVAVSRLPWRIVPNWTWYQPWLTLVFKWLLYFGAGFLLAAAVHQVAAAPFAPLQSVGKSRAYRGTGAVRAAPVPVTPSPVGPNLHVPRQILFALGFLLVVLLFSEPFLSQDAQPVEFPFRLQLPMMGKAAPALLNQVNVKSSIMNQLSLLTLLLFFVLQALLYSASLVKLAEIRRQNVPPRIKLKLLENEDHLFDAGLYLGFVGTIISLILVSLGVIKPSLMAAYSSTSFGIIFVSIFKIFHLRPLRRKMLLDAELLNLEQAPAAGARTATVS